jgi:uncharacterized membrane protein YkvA (DUF1232 family)
MSATTPQEPISDSPINALEPAPVSRDRAERFYDRLRHKIHRYVEGRGALASTSASVLLLVPDMFMLLWRLATDPRVSGKNKALLGSGIAYYLFPLDFMPEAILGPIAFADDLILAVYTLNKILTDTDAEILREHWSGEEDVLHAMQRILNSADNLVSGDLLGRLKNLMK